MAKPIRQRNKYRIRWLDAEGKRCSEVYSTYKEAEFSLRRHQTEVEEVKRGLRAATPPDRSFAQLCDYWMANRLTRKRRKRDDECIIRVHLRPAFGHLRVRDLERGLEHVDAFVASKHHLNSKTVHNHLTLLISMLYLAIDLGWMNKMPRIRKPKIELIDTDFQFLRNDEEIRKFLAAAAEEDDIHYVLYATAIYSGMRQGELAGLRKSDIDFDRRLITIQRSYEGPTKSGRVRYVPILDPLLPILRSWCLRVPGALVFPNNAGNMQSRAARVFKDGFYRTLNRAEFPMIERDGKMRRYIRFHDLRHTFASQWVMKSGDIFKLQKILGHQSIQMTMRYAHLTPTAFAGDYDRLGSQAPSSTVATVTTLPSAK